MRLVIIESPYAASTSGGIELNLRYLRACMADCLARGEAPYASHGLYTQPGVLDDGVPVERTKGINAGFAWRERADATVVYTDLGTSVGMGYGIRAAERLQRDWDDSIVNDGDRHVLEYRALGYPWNDGMKALVSETFDTSRWAK